MAREGTVTTEDTPVHGVADNLKPTSPEAKAALDAKFAATVGAATGQLPADTPPADGTPPKPGKTADAPPKDAPPAEPADDADAEDSIELTPSQRRMAKDLGYSDEEMTNLTDADVVALEKAGRRLSRRMSDWGRKLQDAPPAPAAAAPKPGAAEDAGPDAPKGASASGPLEHLTDADLDETGGQAVLAKINRMVDAINARDAQDQVRQTREFEAAVDDWFTENAEAFPFFGKGRTADLPEGSPERQARDKTRAEADQLAKFFLANGQDLTVDEAFARAMTNLHPDAVIEAERKRIGDEINQRRGKGGRRPSNRRARPTPATTEAEKLQTVGDAMKKAGMPVN